MSQRKTLSQTERNNIVAEHCYCCDNCKTMSEELIIHHIVPVSRGGADNRSNLSVLCPKCHALSHDIDLNDLKWSHAGGRPSKITKEKYAILDDYIECRIGLKETKQKLGLSPKTHLTDSPAFKRYLQERHIKDYVNYIDLLASNSLTVESGFVRFENGETIFYKSTPTNYVTTVKKKIKQRDEVEE